MPSWELNSGRSTMTIISNGNQKGPIWMPNSLRRRCFRKGSGWRSSQLLSWFQSPQYRALEANIRFPRMYLSGGEGLTRGDRIHILELHPWTYSCVEQWRNNKTGQLLDPSPGESCIFYAMKWPWHIWTLASGCLWHWWLCKQSGRPILGIVRLHNSAVNGLFRWIQQTSYLYLFVIVVKSS